MNMNLTWRSAVVIIAVPIALTACSGRSAEPPASDPTTTAKAKAADRTTAGQQLPAAEKIVNEPDARKDVTLAGCSTQDGGWRAIGKIKNTKKESLDYTIVISFTNEKSTVLARSIEKVTVAAGKSKDWAAEARFRAPKKVVCVLRGVDRS
jgi:uncharacterized lipoprotein YbaY